jgi:hypothetical protein
LIDGLALAVGNKLLNLLQTVRVGLPQSSEEEAVLPVLDPIDCECGYAFGAGGQSRR